MSAGRAAGHTDALGRGGRRAVSASLGRLSNCSGTCDTEPPPVGAAFAAGLPQLAPPDPHPPPYLHPPPPNPSPSLPSPPGISWECKLGDAAGNITDASAQHDWRPCTSPVTYPSLPDGSYQFAVRAQVTTLLCFWSAPGRLRLLKGGAHMHPRTSGASSWCRCSQRLEVDAHALSADWWGHSTCLVHSPPPRAAGRGHCRHAELCEGHGAAHR